jgi:alpha 1,3-glucosidase
LKKYLIRDPYKLNTPNEVFVGHCWPGASVWPDFLQKKVRQVWATLYSHDILYKSNNDFHAWNDMNEPSVFDLPELTLPKEAL